MLSTPAKQEIDQRTMKLLVGLMALTLANLTSFFSNVSITSISASYYQVGWSETIFVGFLFAIAAFLAAYNGQSRTEMLFSKVAGVAALGVALFPCGCDGHDEIIKHVHAGSAAAMFLVLTYFCWLFYARAKAKGHTEAKVRAGIYAVCGFAIVLSIVAIVAYSMLSTETQASMPRFVFYGERTGLWAFALSWLTASRVLPGLSAPQERFNPLS